MRSKHKENDNIKEKGDPVERLRRSMKVVLVIPTYNEKDNIGRLISVLEDEIFPQIKNHEMAILVADDNSPDKSADVVRSLMKKYKNIELSMGEKKGLGAAYIRGMTYAIEKMGAEVMFEIDADLSHDPKKVPEFLKKIDEGYDMVIGTRYSQGGSIPSNWGVRRKMFSVLGNLLVRTILMKFSIHDWTGGFRALRKGVFLKEKDELHSYVGYTFQVSFLNKAVGDGFKIAEVPINFTDRTLGRSKIAPLNYIINLLYYVITAKIHELVFGSFGKFLVVGGTGFLLNAVGLRLLVEVEKMNPSIANLVANVFVIFINYNLNNLWTFSHNKSTKFRVYLRRLLQFYLTSSIGVIFIQTGTIFLGDNLIGRKFYFIYFLVGTAFLLVWNFTIYSKFIWKTPKNAS